MAQRKLYHVVMDEDLGWGSYYEEFVVCCVDESAARKTHPSGILEHWGDQLSPEWVPWKRIDRLAVTYRGVADASVGERVVCPSYYAG